MFEETKKLEICDRVESLQTDMKGFTDLLHLVTEGIRTGNVGTNEITNAAAVLYLLSEMITNQVENIREKLIH